MNREKSCGAVVYTLIEGQILYLLVKNHKGVYGFPKGHVKAGETERETAEREIWEETSLRVTLTEGFREMEMGLPTSKPDTEKDVVYFAATYENQTPHPQLSELSAVELHTFEEARALLPTDSRRDILKKANDFLCSYPKADGGI